MKKYIVIAFLLAIAILALASQSYAADWSQYESGRNNVRLDGYDSQPGYLRFTDGNGTTTGYIWCVSNVLYFVTSGGLDLTTTKLTTNNSGKHLILANGT